MEPSGSQPHGRISLGTLLNDRDPTCNAPGPPVLSSPQPLQNPKDDIPPRLPVSFSLPNSVLSPLRLFGSNANSPPSIDHAARPGPASDAPATSGSSHPVPWPFVSPEHITVPSFPVYSTLTGSHHFSPPAIQDACYAPHPLQVYSVVRSGSLTHNGYVLPPLGGVQKPGSAGGATRTVSTMRLNREALVPRTESSPGNGGGVLSRSDGARDGSVSVLDEVLKGRAVTDIRKAPHGTYCELCGKLFKTKQGASRHHRTVHLGLKPHACPDCESAFGQKCSLQRHQRSVHKKQVFKMFCEHAGCGQFFTDYRLLQDHMRMAHDGAQPFKCHVPDCNASFMWSTSYSHHVSSRHGPGNVAEPSE